VSKGLIIRKEWLDKILYHGKRWEMRSTDTKYRGVVKLIQAKSGLILGETILHDSFKVDAELAKRSIDIHQVIDLSLLEKWSWAWSLTNTVKYEKPTPYSHTQGAVIWVNL
jgi:hypothetical protein